MKEDLLNLYKEYSDYVDDYVDKNGCFDEQEYLLNSLGRFMEWIETGVVVKDNVWAE